MGYPKLMDWQGDIWIPDKVNPGAYVLEKDDDGWFANRAALEMVWGPLAEVED
jgi:hypothetical protein